MDSDPKFSIDFYEAYKNQIFIANEQVDVALTFRFDTGGNLELSDLKLCPGLEINMDDIFITEYEGKPGYVRSIIASLKILEGYETENNFVSVNGADYVFINGDPGESARSSLFTIDSKLPTLDIVISNEGQSAITTLLGVEVKFIFSEAVFGFSAEDIVVTNEAGTIELVGQDTNDPKIYKAIFTPYANIAAENVAIKVKSKSYSDLHGNEGLEFSSTVFSVDTRDLIKPVPIIKLSSDTAKAEGVDFTVSFDELVTGFDKSDLQLTASDGFLTQTSAAGDGNTFTFHYSPGTNWQAGGGLAQIAVKAGGYTDLAGNIGLASDIATFNVDVKPPIPTITISDHELARNETCRIVFDFDEPVHGFDLRDIHLSDEVGSLGDFQPVVSAGATYSYSVIFTPEPGTERSGVKILVDGGGYTDGVGNSGLYAESLPFNVDTKAPEAVFILPDPAPTQLISGESLKLKIIFTEAVENFDLSDLSINQGAGVLSDFTPDDEAGKEYSVIFTPQSDIEQSGVRILLNGEYEDLAGNVGSGTTSPDLSIDTRPPVASIEVGDAHLTRGESTLLTFTFTEAVSNFTADDVLLDGSAAGLTQFTEVEAGKKFTALYTPPAETIDASNIFSIVKGGYTDLAGNAGEAAQSDNVSIDTVGKILFGTTGSDAIVGTAGADRISGLPPSGAGAGKDSSDLLLGLGGADVFVLGNHTTAFYNDGNNSTAGTKDFAAIGDFSIADGDKIEVKAGTYFFSALTIGKLPGAGLYLDTNNSGAWDAKDELIGFLVGVNPGSVSAAHDLIPV